jgi:quercetin dioxygenase-like cupin family protein
MQSKASISQVEGDAALYALGALSARDAESFRQRLAAGCGLCRGLLEECRGVVEMLPLAAPEVEPPAGLRSRLMSRIGADSRPSASDPADGHLVRANDTAWQDGPAAGVEYRPLHGSKTMLVRMAPNTWLPAHDHKWNEQCLVLEGSITSEGVTAGAGDFVYMPAGSVHGAIFSETGATFLIAYT